MLHKILAAVSLLTMSACNSTDVAYSQGPWGQGHARRIYPEYAAPWGRHLSEPSRYVIAEPGAFPGETVEIDVAPVERRRDIRLEADMGPLPPAQDLAVLAPPEPAVLTPPVPVAPDQAAIPTAPPQVGAQSNPPGVFTAPQRATSYAGAWNASVGAASCKVQLSSVPSLDLYKASTQGCNNETLRSVNGWSFRENQVILFSRGQVVARLSGAEAALGGTLSPSGAAIRMSR